MESLISIQEESLNNLRRNEKNFRKTPKDRLTQPYIQTKMEILEQQFKEFKEEHKAIISKASKEKTEVYFTESWYETFEDIYVQYKTMLLEKYASPESGTAMAAPGTSCAASDENRCAKQIKLPTINLPTFSGKYEEWQSFYDIFSSIIHSNNSISPVEKLHYLKGNLSGEPLNLLRNYSTTQANYEEAWEELVRRYNNKRWNCNSVLKIFFAPKKINIESASAIKQLLDNTSTCLKSLQNIGIDTASWNPIIVYVVISKLDPDTIKQWEQHIKSKGDDIPTWEQLQEYLESRFRGLEMAYTMGVPATQTAKPTTQQQVQGRTFHTSFTKPTEKKDMTGSTQCPMCQENHYIYHCKQFGLMTPKCRQDFVQNNRLCFNCLSLTHGVRNCRQSSCRKCGKRHHTLLHFQRDDHGTNQAVGVSAKMSPSDLERESTSQGDPHVTVAFSRGGLQPDSVLLATARVKVFSSTGCKQIIRALLDQGSQASFVTEATVQLLGLKRTPVGGWVSGLGDGRTRIKHTVSLRVESHHTPESSIFVNAYVLHSLTSMLPAKRLHLPEWDNIKDLPLADPCYATPGRIDVLLGAEVYGEILLEGILKNSKGTLMAQNTVFGWILSGRATQVNEQLANTTVTSMHVQIEEDDLLRKFWEMEDEPNSIEKRMTREEKLCEDYYEATTTRDSEGRLVVRLPFSSEDPKCQYGGSREIAIKRLEILERRLLRNPGLREEYNKVMDDYLNLNHMRRIDTTELEKDKAVYLPHHAVVREDKEMRRVKATIIYH